MNISHFQPAAAIALASLALAGEALAQSAPDSQNIEIVPHSEVVWEQLNPARGDQSPQAGTLWGDRHGPVPTGFLAKFVDGFSSPRHIHNATYRAVVISGSIHNDHPDAPASWMPPGSFWTQPKGQLHITSAQGLTNVALVEIDQGPYLVQPPEEAYDGGERPINVHASNLVWIDPPGFPSSIEGPKIAHLWGGIDPGQSHGSFIKLPTRFRGEIHAQGTAFRAVVISGNLRHFGANFPELEPGSYFSSTGNATHAISSTSVEESILYVRTNHPYQIEPASSDHVTVPDPNGWIDLVLAPETAFAGKIFFLNDWDGGDLDNQIVGQELNRNSRIKTDITILSDLPGRDPRKVSVNGLVKDARVLAEASKQGPIAIAMGAHARHLLAWLTELPASEYNFSNISVVTHSNWNEVDGRKGYDTHQQAGDPPLLDSHGADLRRGLYPSLAKISDLGVTIWEIARTDFGPGGWGGNVSLANGDPAMLKSYDISDLGLVHYLKTGKIEATWQMRNAWVSPALQKPQHLQMVPGEIVTRYWDKNENVPGEKSDYRR